MSVIQSGIDELDPTTIYFKDCPNMDKNEADEGGVFYLNQPYMIIHLLNVVISNSKATKRAGVISIMSGASFVIEDSTVRDVQSKVSSILYSTSTQLQLRIKDS